MWVICPWSKTALSRTQSGLSETSSSSKEGGRGSRASGKVPSWRYARTMVLVHVLAHEHRPVALVLQPGGHRRALVPQFAELPCSSARPPVADDPVVVGVLSAQDGGPGRAAQGVCHEGVLEGSALGRQLAEVGVVRQVLLKEAGVEVVDEDEDHIGMIRCFDDARWRAAAGGEQANRYQQCENRRVDLPAWLEAIRRSA